MNIREPPVVLERKKGKIKRKVSSSYRCFAVAAFCKAFDMLSTRRGRARVFGDSKPLGPGYNLDNR